MKSIQPRKKTLSRKHKREDGMVSSCRMSAHSLGKLYCAALLEARGRQQNKLDHEAQHGEVKVIMKDGKLL